MHKGSILLGVLLALAMAHVAVVNANSVCPGSNQPVHTYGLSVSVGANSNTLSEQTSGSPLGSIGGGAAGNVLVDDTNTADCNGDGQPGDFDGDFDVGGGGAFFGSSNAWDFLDDCGYDLNVHATSGTATDVTSLPVSGTFGVDDTQGPVVVTDPTTGATIWCQTDGSITPDTDANDCLNAWVNTWSAGACAGTGGDDGYWLFLNTQVSEDGGVVTAQTATTGTLAADF